MRKDHGENVASDSRLNQLQLTLLTDFYLLRPIELRLSWNLRKNKANECAKTRPIETKFSPHFLADAAPFRLAQRGNGLIGANAAYM